MTSLHQIDHEFRASWERSKRRREIVKGQRPMIHHWTQIAGPIVACTGIVFFLYELTVV